MIISIAEAAYRIGVDEKLIIECIKNEWIIPAGKENLLDGEDMARIRLIHTLLYDFDVNDEAIPIILRLLDQIHFMQSLIRKDE